MHRKASGISILFILFFIFLYIQHQFVYLYFDDYGYASLSYGYTGNTAGMDYTLGDIFRFIKWHYMEWGGRVLYYCLGIIFMKTGLWCIRLVQCLLILGISIYSYRLIEIKGDVKGNYTKALLIIFLYAGIGIGTFREGIFWFSAAMGYVWALCPFFAAIYYQKRYHGTGKRICLVLSCILFFVASFSYEQVALMTTVYTILYYLFARLRGGKWEKGGIFVIFSALLGSGIEILAPGNFVRAGDEANEAFFALPFLGKLSVNIPNILEINLGYDHRISVLVFLAAGLMAAWMLFWQKRESLYGKLNFAMGLVLSAGVVVSWRMGDTWYRCGMLIAWIVWFAVSMTLVLWEKANWMVALFYGGICSQGMMLLSPTIPVRCHIPFLFVMHMMAAYVVAEFFARFLGSARGIFLGVLAVMAALNIFSVTAGYYRNAEINEINQYKLTEKSFRIRAGMKVPSIVLYRMRDDQYAAQMPYNAQYIEHWMKNYYELPQSVHFIWETVEIYDEIDEIVVSKRPKIASIYPGAEDREISYNEDGSLNIGVTPEILKSSLRIWINDRAFETVIDEGFVSARVPKEMLGGTLHIWLVDEENGESSEVAIMETDR